MIYRENGDSSSVVVDLVDDAEVTATGAVLAFDRVGVTSVGGRQLAGK